jgi:hypothetical protein
MGKREVELGVAMEVKRLAKRKNAKTGVGVAVVTESRL